MNLKTKSRYFTLPNTSTSVELLGKPLWIAGNIFMEHYQNLSLTDIEGEVWKEIPNSKGFISNFGRVKLPPYYSKFGKLLYPERIKKQQTTKGYKHVSVNSKKNAFIHRLVASAFIPNPNNLPQVNHKNFIRHDNHVENLEWCTADDNRLHAVLAGKTTLSLKTARRIIKQREPNKTNVTYVYLDNGEFYQKHNNFAEVKRAIGISEHAIKTHLDKPTSYLGFAFRTKYTKTIEPSIQPLKLSKVEKIYYIRKQPNENKTLLARKPIKVTFPDGKQVIYESITKAGKYVPIKSKHISRAIAKGYNCKGHKFELVNKESPKEIQLILF